MYKLFMTMCVLVNGEVQCTNYDDSEQKIYKQLANCEQNAAMRFYGMADVFNRYGQPYKKLIVGCTEVDKDS